MKEGDSEETEGVVEVVTLGVIGEGVCKIGISASHLSFLRGQAPSDSPCGWGREGMVFGVEIGVFEDAECDREDRLLIGGLLQKLEAATRHKRTV